MFNLVAAAVCLLGLSAAPALAQDFQAGVEGGISYSRVSPDAAGETVTRAPGALVGAWMSVQPWVPVGIQIEAVFAQKHSHLTSHTDLKLDYFEIPVLAKLKLFKSIYMLEGVAVGFPVSARSDSSSAGGPSVDIKDQVNNPDIGLVIAGVMPVSRKVAIEFRYEGGFKTVETAATAPLQRNRSLSGILRIKLS
jgi:hypothetical protein